jgi:protein SCO1/2
MKIRLLIKDLRLTAVFTSFLLIAILMAGCRATAVSESEREFAGALVNSPQPVPDFTLTSVNGPVSLSDYAGKYVFLYFGYTFCPDICPGTLSNLAAVRKELGEDADKMQVIMVSVDPERDTPDVLEKYVSHFDPSFIGITGSKEEIDAAGEPLGIYYEIHEGSAASGYLVDHTARSFLIDPKGNARVAYPHDAPRDGIVADLEWFFAQE